MWFETRGVWPVILPSANLSEKPVIGNSLPFLQ
jgi:hypothetical protein